MNVIICTTDQVQMEAVAERTRNSSGLTLLIGTALASVYRPAKMLLPVYGEQCKQPPGSAVKAYRMGAARRCQHLCPARQQALAVMCQAVPGAWLARCSGQCMHLRLQRGGGWTALPEQSSPPASRPAAQAFRLACRPA